MQRPAYSRELRESGGAGEAQVLVTVGDSEPRIDSFRLRGDDEVTVAVSIPLAGSIVTLSFDTNRFLAFVEHDAFRKLVGCENLFLRRSAVRNLILAGVPQTVAIVRRKARPTPRGTPLATGDAKEVISLV